jgi:required for meiotic nuclear division protein 1
MSLTTTEAADLDRRVPTDRPVPVHAFLLGERLHLRGLYDVPLDFMPLVLPAGAAGFAMLFRYGAAVLINLTAAEQAAFLESLKPRVEHPLARPETESTQLLPAAPGGIEGTGAGGIGLNDLGLPRLQVVAIALARSVALAQYETAMAASFDAIEPLARSLEQQRGRSRDLRKMLKLMGGALLAQHKMVGRVEIQDKPDILWDHPELERLFLRLEDEYELAERSGILEEKLALVARTVETAATLLYNRRMLRVEWYIVILIVAEVVLFSYEIWWTG